MTIRSSLESPSTRGRPLLARHDPSGLVAFGGRGVRTRAHLLRDAARVAARLPEPFPGSHVLLAIRGDRYAFAAGLLGTWARGHAAALPPDAGRDWILRLAQRDDTAAVLHDTETDAPIRIDSLLAETSEIEPLSIARIEPPEQPVTLYSGDPSYELRGWPKHRSQLLGEAGALASHFALPPGFGVVATVPPSQQYGLACSVLWPLIAGGAFAREMLPREIPDSLRGRPDAILVSVPSHLRALARAPELLASVSHVISSRAALSGRFPCPVTELFGSTATGTIGVRLAGTAAGYRPLPGVELSASSHGELLIDSPWLAPDQPRPYPTGDFARVTSEAEFVPRGRAGEVELGELESKLVAFPGVADAIVVRAGLELYAALLADPARPPEPAFVRAAFPGLSRILVLPHLPRSSTGRPRRRRILEKFSCTAAGTPLPFGLDWREHHASEENGTQRHTFRVHIPRDYGHFAGHFTGYPILPGAAQLSELVLPCVRRVRPELGQLEQMTRIKFSGRIQPDEQIAIGLRWRDGERTLEFTLHRDDTLCATGRLSFSTGTGA